MPSVDTVAEAVVSQSHESHTVTLVAATVALVWYVVVAVVCTIGYTQM